VCCIACFWITGLTGNGKDCQAKVLGYVLCRLLSEHPKHDALDVRLLVGSRIQFCLPHFLTLAPSSKPHDVFSTGCECSRLIVFIGQPTRVTAGFSLLQSPLKGALVLFVWASHDSPPGVGE